MLFFAERENYLLFRRCIILKNLYISISNIFRDTTIEYLQNTEKDSSKMTTFFEITTGRKIKVFN